MAGTGSGDDAIWGAQQVAQQPGTPALMPAGAQPVDGQALVYSAQPQRWVPAARVGAAELDKALAAERTAASATYVSVKNAAGAPVTNRITSVVLDEFGDVTDIVSEVA